MENEAFPYSATFGTNYSKYVVPWHWNTWQKNGHFSDPPSSPIILKMEIKVSCKPSTIEWYNDPFLLVMFPAIGVSALNKGRMNMTFPLSYSSNAKHQTTLLLFLSASAHTFLLFRMTMTSFPGQESLNTLPVLPGLLRLTKHFLILVTCKLHNFRQLLHCLFVCLCKTWGIDSQER